jgi:magnesium chelatase subunit D
MRVPEERLDEITELCAAARVEGLRADIVIYKTSCAIAAFDGRDTVISADVREAQALALAHRRPPTCPPPGAEPSGAPPDVPPPSQPPPRTARGTSSSSSLSPNEHIEDQRQRVEGSDHAASHAEARSKHFSIGHGVNLALVQKRRHTRGICMHGKRIPTRSCDRRGAFVRAITPRAGEPLDLAIEATLRAAALDRPRRPAGASPPLKVLARHWRAKQRRTRTRNLIVFVVDASSSMTASARMRAAKGAVCALLEEAYQKRDYITLIAFRGEGAECLLPPTRSAVFAYRRLGELPAGGRTPLASGLRLAGFEVEGQMRKDAHLRPFLVLVSDGRATVPEHGALEAALCEADRLREQPIASLVIDTEAGWLRLGQARLIAERLGAIYHHISDLPPKAWGHVVREWVAASVRISTESAL